MSEGGASCVRGGRSREIARAWADGWGARGLVLEQRERTAMRPGGDVRNAKPQASPKQTVGAPPT